MVIYVCIGDGGYATLCVTMHTERITINSGPYLGRQHVYNYASDWELKLQLSNNVKALKLVHILENNND